MHYLYIYYQKSSPSDLNSRIRDVWSPNLRDPFPLKEFFCRKTLTQTETRTDIVAKIVVQIIFEFLQVSTEEEFSDLPRELLLNLLPSEDLHVDSEYQVFQAALSWLEHDVGSRRRFVFDILKHVRLPLVPSKQLDEYQAQCRDLSLQVALNRLVRKPS